LLKYLISLVFFIFPVVLVSGGDQAVTYTFSQGRFGDQLLAYMHAKWISYRYDVPLIYLPFDYSKFLLLDKVENQNKSKFSIPTKKIILGNGVVVNPKEKGVILYVVKYFPESAFEIPYHKGPIFEVDWKNPGFRAELKRLISPLLSMPPIDIPPGRIPVAAHIRKGGGYDVPGGKYARRSDLTYARPEKFPPHEYYVEQIKTLYKLFNEKPLYVHIFTDDKIPTQIVEAFQQDLAGLNIVFGCRDRKNAHDRNVLEDFFAMAKFDALIRPDSNYSITAEKIADFKIVISPAHISWENDRPVIDKVNIVTAEQT
jgi:hypothetical protein